MRPFLEVAIRQDVVRRGIRVGIVVGTILVAINHGEVILAGRVSATALLQMVLTYLVPYFVSTYASVRAIQQSKGDPPKDDDP